MTLDKMNFILGGGESPAVEIRSLIERGVAASRQRVLADLGSRAPRNKAKSKAREKSTPKDVHDIDSSSEDERRVRKSRSRRRRSSSHRRSRTRSRSPTSRSSYCAYNWEILGQYWPIDQRPEVPFQEYKHANFSLFTT